MPPELRQDPPTDGAETGPPDDGAAGEYSGSDADFHAFRQQQHADYSALAGQVVDGDPAVIAAGAPAEAEPPAEPPALVVPPDVSAADPPDAGLDGIRAELQTSRELNERLLAALESKAPAAEEPAAKDPWELTTQELARDHARHKLGANVPDHLLDQWSTNLALRDRWTALTTVTADRVGGDEAKAVELRAKAVAQVAAANTELRAVHARSQAAASQTTTADRITELEARIEALTSAPGNASKTAANRTAVLSAITPEVLVSSKYPLVAAQVKAGSLELGALLQDVDFAAVDMAKPDTMAGLDQRIAGVERYLASRSAAKPPTVAPPANPQNPAGLLPPPAVADQSKPDDASYVSDAAYDEDFARFQASRQRVRDKVDAGPISQRPPN